MDKGGYYLLLVLFGTLLFQQCSNGDKQNDQQEEEASTPSLNLILDGETVNASEIKLAESKIINTWASKILDDSHVEIEPDVQMEMVNYKMPYSWLTLRIYLEDLMQFELYTKASRRAIAPRTKGIPIPPSWEEIELEDVRYPLVRKWIIDAHGYSGEDVYGKDSLNYLNPFYQKLRTNPVIDESKYAATLNLYNLLLTSNMEEEVRVARENIRWNEELTQSYQRILQLTQDSLYTLVSDGQPEMSNLMGEDEKADYQRQLVGRVLASFTEQERLDTLARLAYIPLPEAALEMIITLSQLTRETSTSIDAKTATLQSAYDTSKNALDEQELKFFQQVFVYCKKVNALQENLLKRLAPYLEKDADQISLLSLMDILEAIDQILLSDQKSQYSEIESYLYEIKKTYYQKVREAEAAFLAQ